MNDEPVDFSKFVPDEPPVPQGAGAPVEAPDFSKFVPDAPVSEAPDFSKFVPDASPSFGDKVGATITSFGAAVADGYERSVQGVANLAADAMKEYPFLKYTPPGVSLAINDAAQSAFLGRESSPDPARPLREFARETGRVREPIREARANAEAIAPTAAKVSGVVGDFAGVIPQAVIPGAGIVAMVGNAGQATEDMLPETATEEQRALARAGGGITGIADRIIPGGLAATGVRQIAMEAGKQALVNVAQGTAQRGVAVMAGANEGAPENEPRVRVLDPEAMAFDAGLGVAVPVVGAVGRKGIEAFEARRARAGERSTGVPPVEEAPPVAQDSGPAHATEEAPDFSKFVPEEPASPPMSEAGEGARAPAAGEAAHETFTADDFYGVPSEAVNEGGIPERMQETDTSVPFEAALTPQDMIDSAAWRAESKPGVDADLSTGEPVWHAVPESRLMAALDLPEYRAQAEAELTRRMHADLENDARAESGLSLRKALNEGLLKLPSGEGDLRSEILALHKNTGDQAQWARWSSKGWNLERTLAEARGLGFDLDRNGLLDAIDKTLRGKDTYANAEAGVLSDKSPQAPAPKVRPVTPAQDIARREAMQGGRKAFGLDNGAALPEETAGRVSIDPTGGERYVFPAESSAFDQVATVKLARELGAVFKVMEKMPAGESASFDPRTNRLKLSAELFKNPKEAVRVMTHELGHLIDKYGSQLKGPVWERLTGLPTQVREAFALDRVSEGRGRIPDMEDRKGAWLASQGITEAALGPREEYIAASAEHGTGAMRKAAAEWDAARAREFRDHWNKLVTTEGWATGDLVRDELQRWSETIRPYDKASASSEFRTYRDSPAELYADAMTGILAYPETFAAAAPTAWRAFWGHMENFPVTGGKILGAMEILRGSPEARAKSVSIDFQKGGERAAERYLDRMREERDARERIDADKLKSVAMGARRTLLDKFAPARDSGNTLRLDDAAHADGKTWAWTGKLKHGLYDRLQEHGIDTRDFGELLMNRRIISGDRSEFANPGGRDKSFAWNQQAQILKRYSPEQRAVIGNAMARVTSLWREAMNEAVAKGLISPAKLAELRAQAGDAYVPFAAAEYFDGHVGAGIKAMKGHLGDIADPLFALALKGGSVFRAAALNDGRLAAMDGLRRNVPGLQATLAEVGQDGRAKARPRPGFEHVEMRRGGEPEVWNVPTEYADIFKAMTPANAAPLAATTKWAFANFWRQAQIGLNPAFQFWSGPIKDARRSFINMPGGVVDNAKPGLEVMGNIFLNALEGGAKLPGVNKLGVKVSSKLMSEAQRAARDFVEGRPNATVDALVREGGMPPPHEMFAVQKATAPAHAQDAAFLELFHQRKLLPEEAAHQSGWTNIVGVKQAVDAMKYVFGPLAKWIERTGQTNEAVVKLSAFKHLTENMGWSEQDAGRFVRTQIGIPDTRQGGSASRVVNAFVPYYNVATAGLRSDLNQLVRGLPEFSSRGLKGMESPQKVRARAFTRMAILTGVPVALGVLARQGLFGDKVKETYDRVSDHDDRTGNMIPVGETRGRDGQMKSVFIKVPYDATEAWFANAMKNSLEASLGQTTVSDAASEQLKATTDFVPGLDPTLNLVRAWASYAKGDNPTDNWRQAPIVRRSAQGARATGELRDKLQALWDMSAWSLAQTGWWSHKPDDGGPDAQGAEGAAAMPFLSRALRVTNAGEAEKLRKADAVFDGQADALRATLPEPVQALARELSGVRDLAPTLMDKAQREGINSLSPYERNRLERSMLLNQWGSSYNELLRGMVLAKRAGKTKELEEMRRALDEISKPYAPGAGAK